MIYRDRVELMIWIAVLLMLVSVVVDRQRISDRATAALAADGYEDVQILGRDCRVAQALDRNGERVTAYACSMHGGW